MNRHCLLLPIVCLPLFAGCATQKSTGYNPYQDKAESFSRHGKHQQAANIYKEMAKKKPAQNNEYTLLAIKSLIQSGNVDKAQQQLDKINTKSLSYNQHNHLNLLYAQISLSQGKAKQALKKLLMTEPYNLILDDQIIFYQSLAFTYLLMDRPLYSVQARIELTPLLDNLEKRDENNRIVLETLRLLPDQTLTDKQPFAPDILGGWMALAKLLNNQQNSTVFQAQMDEWKQLFPQHPAAHTPFFQSKHNPLTHDFKQPATLALLLPESGSYAASAHAIKKGFMLAYAYSEQSLPVRVYDTSSDNPIDLYHQAIADGAELIIGPLSKKNIETIALGVQLTTPLLALNHVENLSKNNLFQFGLSPIDETQQLSIKAKSDGKRKALLLTANTHRGQRIANQLTESWQDQGGRILEMQTYPSKSSDFGNILKKLLNLDESQYRYNKLKRFLGRTLEYTERRRADADALFLFAYPRAARSIYPQLHFYRAAAIPVYATPNVYSGRPNSGLDRDLNKITFCDIPWLFPAASSDELSQQSLRNAGEQFSTRYLKLVALGMDAYHLTEHLADLNNTPYAGMTGRLSLNSDNRITRQLVCAKFINGLPVLQKLNN